MNPPQREAHSRDGLGTDVFSTHPYSEQGRVNTGTHHEFLPSHLITAIAPCAWHRRAADCARILLREDLVLPTSLRRHTVSSPRTRTDPSDGVGHG